MLVDDERVGLPQHLGGERDHRREIDDQASAGEPRGLLDAVARDLALHDDDTRLGEQARLGTHGVSIRRGVGSGDHDDRVLAVRRDGHDRDACAAGNHAQP